MVMIEIEDDVLADAADGGDAAMFECRGNLRRGRFQWLFLLAEPDGLDSVPGDAFRQPSCNGFDFRKFRHGLYFPEKWLLLQFTERLLQFLLRVHDDGAVPRHRLFQWLAGNQQETNAVFSGLHCNFVSAIEDDQRAILGVSGRFRVGPAYAFGRHSERAGGVAEFSVSREYIGERVPSRFDR